MTFDDAGRSLTIVSSAGSPASQAVVPARGRAVDTDRFAERHGHPLGPVIEWTAARRPGAARLAASLVAAGCGVIFVVAAGLTPPEAGFGAHTQLELAPCSYPMLLGIPCPTCGMTTAFAHFARGELLAAFHAQPAGLVIALATVAAGLAALRVILTGKVCVVNWYRVSPPRVALALGILFLAGWLYKLGIVLMSPAG